MYTYFVLDLLFLLVWLFFFIRRPDLRNTMLFLSIMIIPLGFINYLSEPTYWHPIELFHLRNGIEDNIFGFLLGGISGVIYEELFRKHIRQARKQIVGNIKYIVPIIILGITLVGYSIFHLNMMISLIIGLATAAVTLALIRKDLAKEICLSAIAFGFLYFLLMNIWLLIFPKDISWWNLAVYANIRVGLMPLGEFLFGILFGALWGPIYVLVFNDEVSE